MGDLVQRVTLSFGATDTTKTATAGTEYTTTSSNAFARIVAINSDGSGGSADVDLRFTQLFVSTNTPASSVVVSRVTNDASTTVDCYLEIWDLDELPASHSIAVRGVGTGIISSGTATVTTATISGVVTDAAVAILTNGACRLNDVEVYPMSNSMFTAVWNGPTTDDITLTRGYTSGAANYAYVCLEFTGTSWADVQRIEHTFSAADTNESQAIGTTLGATSQAFILDLQFNASTYSFGDVFLMKGWIDSTTNTLWRVGNATGVQKGVAWIIEDTGGDLVSAQYEHTIAASTTSDTDTVTAITSLASSGVFGVCATLDSAAVHGREVMCSLSLTGTTTVSLNRGDGSYALDTRYSVVDFAGLGAGGGGGNPWYYYAQM